AQWDRDVPRGQSGHRGRGALRGRRRRPSGRHDRRGPVSGHPRPQGGRARTPQQGIEGHDRAAPLMRTVQLFRTGDTPLPDVIILAHKLTRESDMGSELVRALRGVSVQIQKNEYVAVMGPSGSGKSTLMNLIGCLDTPTSGEYWLNGQKVSDLADDELARIRNKEIGFVFQTFNL